MDLPTQLGMDPDHPPACGEVGRVGVSIACVMPVATTVPAAADVILRAEGASSSSGPASDDAVRAKPGDLVRAVA
jgi:hypothetical protein